jgi:hypothetical protein
MTQARDSAAQYQLNNRLLIGEKLLNLELFEDLSGDEIDEISVFSKMLNLDDGAILIYENDIDRFDLYVLCKGSLEVVSSNADATSAEVVISKDEKDIFW